MVVIRCAICKEKEKLITLFSATFDLKRINQSTFSARRTPDKMHYQFSKCIRCGLIFSNPILDPGKISELYKKSEFNYDNESNFLAATYGKYLKLVLKSFKNNSLKLLDVGCGNGFFLEKAKELGISDVWGVEPGKDTVEKASKDLKSNIIIDILRPGLFKNNSFDIISCFHTLDHVVDPNSFLNEIHNLLKKEGRILFIVHNTDGLSVKLFGEKSPIFDIEHIYLFNKNTLKMIFQKNGYTSIEIFDVKNTYPMSYWLRMSPLPKLLKQLLLVVFTSLKILDLPINLNAGNIGIIAKK